MLAGALLTATPVAMHPQRTHDIEAGLPRPLPLAERRALVQRLYKAARDCMVSQIRAHVQDARSIGDSVVEAVPFCLPELQALVAAHDDAFGHGSGERFIEGPFLDQLPRAVSGGARD
jgi:hypothetical protein